MRGEGQFHVLLLSEPASPCYMDSQRGGDHVKHGGQQFLAHQGPIGKVMHSLLQENG